MNKESGFETTISGKLSLKSLTPTLQEIEQFCAEARRLGVSNDAKLGVLRRQTFLGPTISWYFKFPVVPKIETETK